MKKKTARKIEWLAEAKRDGLLVSVVQYRDPKSDDYSESYDGYVVGVSDQFVLFHYLNINTMQLDGYIAWPLREIRRYWVQTRNNSFRHRALVVRNIHATTPQNVDLTDFASLVTSIDAHFPLTCIERYRIKPGYLRIGRVAKVTDKSVTLRKISPSARWTKTSKMRFKDITSIEFGGGYEDALWRVSEDERRKQQAGTDQA